VTNPKNNHINPQFKHKYAPLDVVINTIRPVMAEYGLSYTQFTGTGVEPETVTITTLLLHESGEWMESEPLTLPAYQVRSGGAKEYSAQGAGIALTYGRRYQLTAMLGIASEDDDDAEGLGQQQGNGQQAGVTSPPRIERKPPEQRQGNKQAAVDSQADMLRLKGKYQQGNGSIDGFEAWSDKMIKEGKTIAQMEAALDKALEKKTAGGGSAEKEKTQASAPTA
jgi:hypothetical protein